MLFAGNQGTLDRKSGIKAVGKFVDLLIVVAAIEFIPQVSSYTASHLVQYFDFLDPDHAFAWNYLHHITQLVLAILAMKLYFKRSMSDWGFNLNQSKWSLTVFWKFTIGWIVFWTIGTVAFSLLTGHSLSVFNYPLTTRNIAGNLSFMLLMPGPSEEVLFRGFVIIVLSQSWKGHVRIGKLSVSVAGLIAAVLFAYAHIGYSIFPFQIYALNPMQLAMAFGLGIFYAVTFEKTGSLLCPVLSHSASDLFGNAVLYIFAATMH